MGKIDFNPIGETVTGLAIQFGMIMITAAIGFIVVFLLLRLIRVPKQIANLFATAALLVVLYYSFTTDYLPWLQSLVR